MKPGLSLENLLLAGAIGCCLVNMSASAHAEERVMKETFAPTATGRPAQQLAAVAPTLKDVASLSSTEWRTRYGLYFKRNWGIDIVGVRPDSSGQMLTFRYRVLDAERAKFLSDKSVKPFLLDETKHTALAVPALENLGEVRQTTKLAEGRTYFIMFGNPGRLVKSGNRVSVVIGDMTIDDLVVD